MNKRNKWFLSLSSQEKAEALRIEKNIKRVLKEKHFNDPAIPYTIVKDQMPRPIKKRNS